jgi:hypothetical protein
MEIKKLKLVVIERKTNKIVLEKIVKSKNLNKLIQKINSEIIELRKIYPHNLYYINEGIFNEYLINDYSEFYYDNLKKNKIKIY